MQFKRQGGRIQILAYRGYDKTKRRAIIKMLGSIDAYTYKPSDGLLESLTEKEKEELHAYIEKARQEADRLSRWHTASTIVSYMNEAADAIKTKVFAPDPAWAEGAWAALGALAKAIRGAGYPRPPRKARKKAADALPLPGQEALPLPVADVAPEPVPVSDAAALTPPGMGQ